MKNEYIVRIKVETSKKKKIIRVIILMLFACVDVIMFFYSKRYMVYLFMLILILLFRLKMNEKYNTGFINAICKLNRKDNFIILILTSKYKKINKKYCIKYKNIRLFDIDNEKIKIVYNDNNLQDNIIEMYIISDGIEDWKQLKKDIENNKKILSKALHGMDI